MKMFMLATDLDRTLLPNGKQPYDNSMNIFKNIVDSKKLRLIYVTGRDLELVREAISKYNAPFPDAIIGQVGTRIYSVNEKKFSEDIKWQNQIRKSIRNWNLEKFKEKLSLIKELKLQEKRAQNEFKLSYYLQSNSNSKFIIENVKKIIKNICDDVVIIYSLDETKNQGLLDIIPQTGTKLSALEYLRKRLKLTKNKVVYCGDSGNDVLPLTFGYKSILVKNAIPEIKSVVREVLNKKKALKKLHISKGFKGLNGYYVSGIIEGLIKLNMIFPDCLSYR